MNMEQELLIDVPVSLRPILARWGSAHDPALCARAGADVRATAWLCRRLGATEAATGVARQALSSVYGTALHNREFGQFAELRREGAQVFSWIAQVCASDPVLRAQLG